MNCLFKSVCHNYNIKSNVIESWFEKLKKKYSEKHRFYHNEENMFLKKLDFLKNASNYVIFATIFQYYEFDSKKNCVESNCCAFKEFLQDAETRDIKLEKVVLKLLGDESIEEIEDFVPEWEYFQDLDLIVLGSSPREYKQYTELLRQEYSTMNIENYKNMRSKVLQTFLTIPKIYSTKEFYDQFEDIARNNIKNEIIELNKN